MKSEAERVTGERFMGGRRIGEGGWKAAWMVPMDSPKCARVAEALVVQVGEEWGISCSGGNIPSLEGVVVVVEADDTLNTAMPPPWYPITSQPHRLGRVGEGRAEEKAAVLGGCAGEAAAAPW